MDGQTHYDSSRSRRDSTISLDDPIWRSERNDRHTSIHDDFERRANSFNTPRPPASLLIPLDLPRRDYFLDEGSGPSGQAAQPPSRRLFLLERYLLEENNHERRALGLKRLPVLNRTVVRDKLAHVDPTVLGESLNTLRPSHSSQSHVYNDKRSQDSEELLISRLHSGTEHGQSTSLVEKRSRSCPEISTGFWGALEPPLAGPEPIHHHAAEPIEVDPKYLSSAIKPLSASSDIEDYSEDVLQLEVCRQIMQDQKRQAPGRRRQLRHQRRRFSPKNDVPKTTPNKITKSE